MWFKELARGKTLGSISKVEVVVKDRAAVSFRAS